MEKSEPSYSVYENINWYNQYREEYEVSSKKLKMEPAYALEIPLLGIYPEKIQKKFPNMKRYMYPDIHSTTVYNSQDMKQLYTMEYYSAIKKERNNAICSNMDGSRDHHPEWSQISKDKYYMLILICGL